MAIVSVGYDGTVDEVAIANMFPSVGAAQYGVVGPDDWKVTAHPSTAQAVNVAPGAGWGNFVYDTSDSVVTVQCDTITSGATRWDLITVKRDWQPVNGTTVFSKVTGGTTKTLPTRLTNPGVQDEQPIALVQWTGGQTQPTAIVDLRCWATNGGVAAKDDLVKGYLNKPGTQVWLPGAEWRYVPGANDVFEWVNSGGTTGHAYAEAWGSVTINMPSGANFGQAAVTFPAGRFTVAPKMQVSISNSDGGSQSLNPRSYLKTATGGTIGLFNSPFSAGIPNAVVVTVDWHAVQMTPTAAAG